MDYEILKPQVVWINGSCYRKNTLEIGSSQSYERGGDTIDDYGDNQLDNYCQEEEYGLNENNDLANKFNIECANGRYKCRLSVASAFYAIIIGKKAVTKKRIESETKTNIIIPKQVRHVSALKCVLKMAKNISSPTPIHNSKVVPYNALRIISLGGRK